MENSWQVYRKHEHSTLWHGNTPITDIELNRSGVECWELDITNAGSGNSLSGLLNRNQLQELHEAIGKELGI